MYKKGDLRLVDFRPNHEGYHSSEFGHVHLIDDTRDDLDDIGAPCAYLPHSCDEWVIGKPENIKQMIEDLREAIERIDRDKIGKSKQDH